MMQADLHARLVQMRPLLEQGEIEAPVGEADIARRAAADFAETEAADVKVGERSRLRAQQGEIAYP
jgi:hypothetical protein